MPRAIVPSSTNLPFHLTARCHNKEPFPIDLDSAWQIFENYLYFMNFAFQVRIRAFVLMPNHWHLILRSPKSNLSEAMTYFMRETSREISRFSGRINQVYGNRFHRTMIDGPLYYLHAYKYVYRNPVKARIVENVENYRYSTLRGLLGISKLVVPMEDDDTLFSGVEETLSWLNRAPREGNEEVVQKALRRSQFLLPPETKRRGRHALETQMY